MTISLPTPTLHLTPASDTGVSHSDGVTDDDVPVIAGTAIPGALVTITDLNSGLSVQARADKYGNYVTLFLGLQPGVHGLTASATNANGNVSATSNPLAIDIETAASATSTPALVPGTAEAVTFAVHFNQPVSAVTVASFMLVGTGDAYGNIEFVSGSGQDYSVTVAGLGGTGAVALAFSADAPTDVAGNQIALSSALHEVSDTTAGVLTTVSSDKSGVQGTGASPAPSNAGGTVAFISDDPDLVPGGQTTSGVGNVYVKIPSNGQIVEVTNGNDQTLTVEIAGHTVAFSSLATNLVPGGTAVGQLNLYVAKLAVTDGILSLVPGSIQLVGALNPEVYLFDEAGFALSGDGNTLAYEGDTTLADGTTDAPGEFIYNLNTGVTTQFQFAASGDGTSRDSGNITSISYNGTRIAYTASVPVPGTGGQPDIYFGGTVAPNLIQDAFVYDTTSKTTFTIDGSGLLPGTTPPTGEDQAPSYLTQYPVLSGDGSTVVFQLERSGQDAGVSLFSVNLANPSVFSPVSPGASSGGGTEDDYGQSVSQTGAVIAYTSDDPTTGPRIKVYTPATDTTTDLGVGYQAVLTPQGSAIVYDEPTDETGSQAIIYKQTLGVSAGVAPIDGDDAINAMQLKQAKASGLAVSGATNAPSGSAVLLYVSTDHTFVVPSSAFNGVVGDGGSWTATIPAAVAASLTDGQYLLNVEVLDAYGASLLYDTERLFTVDTQAPAQPAIPQLDPGSAAGLGQNGTPVTNTATPTIDGAAEPLSLVSLYADVANGTPAAVASARADQNGVYSITAPHLADGIQNLEVQAVDSAGNASPFSSPLKIIVDTTPPPAPPTPTLLYYSDSPDGPVTDVPRLSVIGTAEPNSDVTLVDAITGDVLATDVVVGADGTYATTTHELADGKYAVAAYATDQAGNVGKPSNGAEVTIDTQAPDAPTIESVSGGTASDGSLSPSLDINGEAEPFSQVALLVDGAPDTIDRAVTADEDGEFDLLTAGLPAGTHTLTVTATDFAGNVSQASAPTTVTISGTPVLPPGAPAGTALLDGTVTDGPISGATVFADTNGNGVRDPDEGSTVTGTDGSFTLADTGGELIASGGTDITTGLRPTLTLTAPAGSSVIDPLTTLLDAYAALTGADPRSVQPQLVAALGLPAGTDLTTLDPSAALLAGNGLAAVLDAKIMDTLTDFQAYLAGNGIIESNGFAAGFTAIADAAARTIASLPAGQTLDLDGGSSLEAIFEDAAGPSAGPLDTPIGGNSNAVITVAAFGNEALTADLQTGGSGLAAAVVATETVYQGAAATALADVGTSAANGAQVVNLYDTSEPLDDALANNTGLTSGPPSLAVDTGRSDADDVIDIETPTFVGTALPGTEVALVEEDLNTDQNVDNVTVIGVGTADALGHYSITAVPLDTYAAGSFVAANPIAYAIGVVGSAPTQGITFSVGETLEVPNTTPLLQVVLDPTAPAQPTITDATVAYAAGDNATQTALYVYGTVAIEQAPLDDEGATISVYADGNPTPIATSSTAFDYGSPAGTSSTFFFGLTTAPLSDGKHVLTVTETLPGGTVVQGTGSYAVTVASPAIIGGTASASGSLEGARVYEAAETLQPNYYGNASTDDPLLPTLVQTIEQVDTVEAETEANGAYQIAEPAADASDLLVATGGRDTLTGLPLGGWLAQTDPSPGQTYGNLDTDAGSLLAPAGSTAISPLTSIEALLLQTKGGGAAAATLAGLGLSSGLNLGTLDTIAEARAGDVQPFLVAAELLDTVTLLAPFIGFSFAPIAYYLGKTGSIDLTSVTQVTAMLTAYFSSIPHVSYGTDSVLATIIADSNAAIASHASAAVSLADTLSYTLAAETVAQEATTAALQAAVVAAGKGVADLTSVTAAFTGANLGTAIDAARAGLAQATGFVAAGPLATSAASVNFTISFGTPVSGLTVADFTAVAGGGLIGTYVTGLVPVAGSDGGSYTVTVATGAGSGSLAIDFAPDASLLAGSFSPVSNALLEPTDRVIDAGGQPFDLTVGDLNGDGRPDAVLLSNDDDGSNQLTVLLNQGDGSFLAAAPILSSNGVVYNTHETVAIGDFNGDGVPDLVVTEGTSVFGQLQVAVLPGRGDGTFGAPIITATAETTPGGQPETNGLAVGDFNHDGKLDIAIAGAGSTTSYYGSTSGDTVDILLGNGDGTFRAGQGLDTQTISGQNDRVTSVDAADLNGDGNLDLVALNPYHEVVDLYLGNGDGTFRAAPSLALPDDDPIAAAIGDVNGDGIPDIVVLDQDYSGAVNVPDASGSVAVFLGKGDGTYTALAPVALPPVLPGNASLPNSLALADMNGDGRLDLVVTDTGGTEVLDGNGDGTFTPAYTSSDAATQLEPGGTSLLAVADVNGDGRPDVLVAGDDDAEADEVGAQIGLNVLLNAAPTVLGSTSQSITIDRPSLAAPALSETSGGGTFTQTGNTYTLDLGTLAFGATTTAVFALANTAAAPADSFDGTFSTPTGSGFTVSGATLSQALAAGASYGGLTFTADTSTPGSHTQTIIFAPRDMTAEAVETTTADDDSPAINLPATPDANAVAAELPAITLTVTDDVVTCYCAGTLIATRTGKVPVEALRVGDHVRTVAGESRPITWIGSRTLDCARHPDPAAVLPVRVRAGAFGPGLPRRALFLSPDHAVFVSGVLVPIKHLIDGVAIAQTRRRQVTYFHIELATHDVLLAEGLPAESYLDTGDRDGFARGRVVRLHPSFGPRRAELVWEAAGYAPLVITGPKITEIRNRVASERARRQRPGGIERRKAAGM